MSALVRVAWNLLCRPRLRLRLAAMPLLLIHAPGLLSLPPAAAVASPAECGSGTCGPGLFCSCVLQAGICNGNFVCTSACQGSYTGPPGGGCATDEVCLYALVDSANEHVCGIVQDGSGAPLPIGNRLGGATCENSNVCNNTCAYPSDGICDDGGPGSAFSVCRLGSDCDDCGPRDNAPDDTLCRSGRCEELCAGCGYTCADYCDHSDGSWSDGIGGGEPGSCGGDASCTIRQGTTPPPASRGFQHALCMPQASPETGSAGTGESCASDPTACRWGPHSCVGDVCAEPCRLNPHCPPGYYCSLGGAFHGSETVPVCLVYPDAGTFALRGGAQCSQNGDCISNFCEASYRICLDMCTDDASCTPGLTCLGVFVELPGGGPVTLARMCLDGPDPLNTAINPYRRVVPPPGEASGLVPLMATPGAGDSVDVVFEPACNADDHAIFVGSSTGPIAALAWTQGHCGLGTSGAATFDPGPIAANEWLYFVLVGQSLTEEGSYGRDSAGVERPEATVPGGCDVPQVLGGACP